MKSKIYKTYKKLGLRTIFGILIILASIILMVIIFIDSRRETGPDSPDSIGITWEDTEEDDWSVGNLEPEDSDNGDSGILSETVTIEYQGLAFTIPASWHVQNTEDGLSIMIVEEEQANLLLIGTLASNTELSLEENLAFVSMALDETIPDLERRATIVSGLPAMRHQYTISVGDVYYEILGFLFPNGDELVYAQFGTPKGEEVSMELLLFVTHMIMTLELPPSQFPPMD